MESTWSWPGSRWWRVDLHAHSTASHDFGTGGSGSTQVARRWIESARDAGLDAVAVTDHNSAELVGQLQEAAADVENAPVVFPGAELTANDGSHILLVLDPSATQDHVDDLLSRIEIPVNERGTTTAHTSASVEEILKRCDDRALVIAAHVNQRKGLLEHSGQQRIAELQDIRLAAVEVHPDTPFDDSWLDGSRPEVGRKISQIWASDSHSFDDLGKRYTWVKMTTPSLEGLRLALLDGDESLRPVRREDPGKPNTHAERAIEKITVFDTKHIGRESPTDVRFNPWLNAIIGGRGTGKSTLLDLFRKALRRDSELDSAGRGEEGSLRTLFDSRMQVPASRSESGLLTDASCVEVVYRKDGERFLLSWSQDGNAHPITRLVGDESIPEEGNILERFPVRLYSQKQLFALAQNPNALLVVLDDTQEVGGAECRRELDRLGGHYLSLRAAARLALTQASELPDRRASLADVQRKLDVLQQGGHAEILRLYRSRRQTDGTWKAVVKATETGLEAIQNTARAISVPDLNPLSNGDDEDDADQALRRSHQSLRQLIDDFRSKAIGEIDEVTRQLAELLRADDVSEWDTAVRASEEAYKRTVNQLEEQGIADPAEYGELVERAKRLEAEIEVLTKESQNARALEKESADALEDYREARCQLSLKREEFARRASSETLRVEVKGLGDHSDLTEGLIDILGIMAFQDDRKLIADRIRPQEDEAWAWEPLDSVVDAMREFQSKESDTWDTRDARFANRLRSLPPERIDRLALYLPEDAIQVSFRGGNSSTTWRPIAQGSPGQQTAALLAFVLGFGSEPIVLDQPEDDLDSTLIYELLVRRFREIKPTRQLILVTHNPNIVVHGDAEFVLSLDVRETQTVIGCEGGLQEEKVRDEICRVMEGGREAFESRYNRIMPMKGVT